MQITVIEESMSQKMESRVESADVMGRMRRISLLKVPEGTIIKEAESDKVIADLCPEKIEDR